MIWNPRNSKPSMAVQSHKHPVDYRLYQQHQASACVRPAALRPFASDVPQAADEYTRAACYDLRESNGINTQLRYHPCSRIPRSYIHITDYPIWFQSEFPIGFPFGWWFGNVWNIFLVFPYIGNVRIPTDFHIVQRGRSTTNQSMWHRIPRSSWMPRFEPIAMWCHVFPYRLWLKMGLILYPVVVLRWLLH